MRIDAALKSEGIPQDALDAIIRHGRGGRDPSDKRVSFRYRDIVAGPTSMVSPKIFAVLVAEAACSVSEIDRLRRENAELKAQLQAAQEQLAWREAAE